MSSCRVLMSTLGRSHFISAADALVRNGCDLDLLQGWTPRNLDSWTVRLATKIVGRKTLVAGFAKRTTPALENHIISEPLGEVVHTVLQLLVGRNEYLKNLSISTGFKLHGFLSRRHLKGHQIFHVKSGLGQGGAIAKAKKMGLQVVVDQGIAHPSFMRDILKAEYEKNDLPHENIDGSFWNVVMKDCKDADILQVNSDFVKDTFVEHGFPADRIRVVYLGVRQDFNSLCEYNYGKRREHLNILFTGAFRMRKGAEYLIATMLRLRDIGVRCQLNVVGSCDSFGRRLQEVAVREKLPIIFHGHIAQDDLIRHFKDNDIYLFPSLSEGCAQSGMEAMSAGLCVVATRESGLPIDHNENGIVVKVKDVDSIVQNIVRLINNPIEVERLGRNAAIKLKAYTWDRYAQNVLNLYHGLLDEK